MRYLTVILLLVCAASAQDSLVIDTANINYDFEKWDSSGVRPVPSTWIVPTGGWIAQGENVVKHGRYCAIPISAIMQQHTKLNPDNDSMYQVEIPCWSPVLGGSVGGVVVVTEWFRNGSRYVRVRDVHFPGPEQWYDFGWGWRPVPYNVDSITVMIAVGCSTRVDMVCVLVMRDVPVGVGEGRSKPPASQALGKGLRPLRLFTTHGIVTRYRGSYYDVMGRKVKMEAP